MSNAEELRLGRLFDGTGNAVIVAMDHGLYTGPQPGLEDLPGLVARLSRADAVLVGPGSAPRVAPCLGRRGSPALIVRLNWGTQYATQWSYHESRSVPVISAGDAVALGADIVLVGMSIKTGSEAVDAENVAVVGRAVAEKRALGVPIVGEVYPAGHEDMPAEERHEQIAIGCRVVAELGVDLVKTFYTGASFSDIVASTPVPVLALGSKKLPREVDALELAAQAVASGARGVVFGRNLIQSRDPERFLDALCEVVKEGADPADAAARTGVG